jgi:hypothetical protein
MGKGWIHFARTPGSPAEKHQHRKDQTREEKDAGVPAEFLHYVEWNEDQRHPEQKVDLHDVVLGPARVLHKVPGGETGQG